MPTLNSVHSVAQWFQIKCFTAIAAGDYMSETTSFQHVVLQTCSFANKTTCLKLACPSVVCLFHTALDDCRVLSLTFSSPLATLNASSTTLPAARRDAVEVCDSFQMVSLSTCRSKNTNDQYALKEALKTTQFMSLLLK